MELVGHEIIARLTSPAVLVTTLTLTVALLSGIAGEVALYIEDLGYRLEARSSRRRPTAARYGTDVASEEGIVR